MLKTITTTLASLLAAACLLALGACGGGGDAEAQALPTGGATATITNASAQGGSNELLVPVHAAPAIGPQASTAGQADVQLGITWTQVLARDAWLYMSVTPGGAGMDPNPETLVGFAPAGQALMHGTALWQLAVQPGTPLQATVRLRALDAAGQPLRVLGSYSAELVWTVVTQP